jgi:hypothetical protein
MMVNYSRLELNLMFAQINHCIACAALAEGKTHSHLVNRMHRLNRVAIARGRRRREKTGK